MLNSPEQAHAAELSMKKVSKFCQNFKIYKQNKFHAQLWAWKKFYNLGAWSGSSLFAIHPVVFQQIVQVSGQ